MEHKLPPFSQFTTKAKQAIQKSHEFAAERAQSYVGTGHLLSALLLQEESFVADILEKIDIDVEHFTDTVVDSIEDDGERGDLISGAVQMYLTPDLALTLEESIKITQSLKEEWCGVEHLLLALLSVPSEMSEIFHKYGISRDKVWDAITFLRKNPPPPREQKDKSQKTLPKYSRNLTELARADKLDPVIGRDAEIMRMVQILSRRTKNNPILIGEPGTGKTAVVEGLAQRMVRGDIPSSLRNKQLLLLDMGLLVAGTKYRGEFEDRLKKIIKEVEESDNSIVLFIDEIHTLIGTGAAEGAQDAANMLKPALARGEMRVIGATTLSEYQKHFERDPALTRRFQSITVDEPNQSDTVAILRGLKHKYELFHGLRITDDALIAAVELSSRYITNRFLPDKAVDLIDEASSQLRISLENKPVELDTAHRKIQRLEIEREGIKRDTVDESDPRITEINNSIAEIRASIAPLEQHWNIEKNLVAEISGIKKQIDAAKSESELAELESNLTRVAELRYSVLPGLESELTARMQKLTKMQKKHKMIREEVTAEDIAGIVAKWTGVPVTSMLADESHKLATMESVLQKRVKGQDEAIASIAHAIRRARTGIGDPGRPVGSFIFLGPTGVGKTELTKALAEFMFDDEKALIRVDMSELMEKHSVAKLVGAPPGYVGYEEAGKFTEAVRHRPYSVILFDEIEKAHPDVFNILLQVLDDGRLTDGKGRVIDFKNTIIVMTSNLGSHHIQKMQSLGFSAHDTDESRYGETKERVVESLEQHFRPEFLNRIDEVVVFDTLSREVVRDIVAHHINKSIERIRAKGISVTITDAVIDLVAEKGYDPKYGARPLRRYIQNNILNQVALAMVNRTVKSGDALIVSLDKSGAIEIKPARGIKQVKSAVVSRPGAKLKARN